MSINITRGKFDGLNACANQRGVIASLAIDHRGNLLEAIADSRGPGGQATVEELLVFKTSVTNVLTPFASAILLDPDYGLGALSSRAPNTGVMLAYEQSGYDVATRGRLPDLLPEQSVRRLVEAGAQAIKILLFYNPFDNARITSIKQAFIERVGAECIALDVPFFLEPLAYDDSIPGGENGAEFASKKPEYVARAIEEFSRERYGVDVLKVEIPVNPAFVSGTRAFTGIYEAYTRLEAMQHFRAISAASSKPLIFLSAGVSDEVFLEMLELAAEAGTRFCGVLCGRATWQDGIAIFGREGGDALRRWLAERGARNIQTINALLERIATPWWDAYGGKDHIQVI